MAGYSGTPLIAKLGYRAGQRALLVGLPPEAAELAGFAGFSRRETLPTLVALDAGVPGPFDLIHVFERDRALALATGLVDVKVCAVDAVWSGLKLVIPRALREN